MNLLAFKHFLFKRKYIKEPKGGGATNLLACLNRKHKNEWNTNYDYYSKDMVEYTSDGLLIKVKPTNPLYFNRKIYGYSDVPLEGYNKIYTHVSGRADTRYKNSLNIYQPGKIISKCTTPQEGAVFSIWLYFEEHPHDKHKPNRDVYFELDIFEMEPRTSNSPFGIIFTHWLGLYQKDADRKTVWLKKKLKGFHYPELSWDGKGNFVWKLDGVVVKRQYLNLPPKLKPYVIYSLGVSTSKNITSEALIEWSKYVKTI